MGIGFRELLVILVIALVLFGAKKLKTVGSDLGSAVRGFKKAMGEGEDEQNRQLTDLTGGAPKDADFAEKTAAKTDSKPSAFESAMFEVGFTEILLIFAIALLVLGPARLPKLAADLGRWAGRARSMARQLRTQLEQEVQFDPLADSASKAAPAQTIHTPATTYAAAPSIVANVNSPNVNPPADETARALPAQASEISTSLPDALPADTDHLHGLEAHAQGSLSFPDAAMQPAQATDDRKPV